MDESMLISVDLIRNSLLITVKMTAPLLIVGMTVGLAISFLQAITQIQEQTLSFVPKMAAVAFAMYAMMPWMIQIMTDYMRDLILNIASTYPPG